MSGTDVFISYARPDRPTASVFAKTLIEEGFDVWWDGSLHSGETFDEVIEQRLRAAKAVVVLWSPRSVASRWVRAEATLADRRNKLLPAIIEVCDRPIIFELTHSAELSEWEGDRSDLHWRMFVDDLQRLVNAGREQDEIGPEQRADNPAQSPPGAPPKAQTKAPPADGARPQLASQRLDHPAQFGSGQRGTPSSEAASAPGEVHCLEIEGSELAGELIIVDSPSVRIGRSAPADVILSHSSVSRGHCVIGLADGVLLVTDLNSTNGTYIDDVRIGRATTLSIGSVLRLGQVSLRHVILAKAEASPRERTRFQAGGFTSG